MSTDASKSRDTRLTDVLVIGAGPAGLTAAMYLARFRRSVLLVDAGQSRALRIPVTHNYPGFPSGISGLQLLHRLRQQALHYRVRVHDGTVESLSAAMGGFVAVLGDSVVLAKRVLLATGVVDKAPSLEGLKEADLAGRLRWCPICDGFEVRGEDVGVYSDARRGPDHALFLRTYTSRVTLFIDGDIEQLSNDVRRAMQTSGVRVVEEPIARVQAGAGGGLNVQLRSGAELHFHTLYPMLGSITQDGLATALGAKCSGGELLVDERQQTSVPGLFAAGDVVKALNQMSVGVGHAAVAATAIHNSLPTNLAGGD